MTSEYMEQVVQPSFFLYLMKSQEIQDERQNISKKYPISLLQINVLPSNLYPKIQKNEVINYVTNSVPESQIRVNNVKAEFVYQFAAEDQIDYQKFLDGQVRRYESKHISPSIFNSKRTARSLNVNKSSNIAKDALIDTAQSSILDGKLISLNLHSTNSPTSFIEYASFKEMYKDQQQQKLLIQHLQKPLNSEEQEDNSQDDSISNLPQTEKFLKLINQQQSQFQTKQSSNYLRTLLFMEEMDLQSQNQQNVKEKINSMKLGRYEEKQSSLQEEERNRKDQSLPQINQKQAKYIREKRKKNITLEIGSQSFLIPGVIAASDFQNEKSLEKAQDIYNLRRNYKSNRNPQNHSPKLPSSKNKVYEKEYQRLKAFSSMDGKVEEAITIQIKNNQIHFKETQPLNRVAPNQQQIQKKQQISYFLENMIDKKKKRHFDQQNKKALIDELINKRNEQKLEKLREQRKQERIEQMLSQKDRYRMIEFERRKKMKLLKQRRIDKKLQQLKEVAAQMQSLNEPNNAIGQDSPEAELEDQPEDLVEERLPIQDAEFLLQRQLLLEKPLHTLKHIDLIKKIRSKVQSIAKDRASDFDANLVEQLRIKQIKILKQLKGQMSLEVKAKLQEELVQILRQLIKK